MLRKPFDLFASLRLAMVTMSALGVVCAVATFYEMDHGTAAVQRVVYQAPWFTALLVILGINILVSMLKRWPWTRHHAGFVLAHVGILAILAGSLISLHWGVDGNMALLEGETSDRVRLRDQSLSVMLPDSRTATVPVGFAGPAMRDPRRLEVPGTEATLVVEAFEPHVTATQRLAAAPAGPPALHFLLEAPFAHDAGWLVGDSPERAVVEMGPLVLGIVAAGTPQEAMEHARTQGRAILLYAALPDGTFIRVLASPSTAPAVEPVELGRAQATPWMGLRVTVDQAFAHAAFAAEMTPAPAPPREEDRHPALRVHVEQGGVASSAAWLTWDRPRDLALGTGFAQVVWGSRPTALPFRVSLLEFRSDRYPGSRMAATYESRVRVEDGANVSEHVVSMNHPLHYGGYVFFQSSFLEGSPMTSILSVTRAPGLPLVYLGTTLLSLGVLWMFYLKPWIARRQGRQALRERQAEAAGGALPTPA